MNNMLAIVPCEHCGTYKGMDLNRNCMVCGKNRPWWPNQKELLDMLNEAKELLLDNFDWELSDDNPVWVKRDELINKINKIGR